MVHDAALLNTQHYKEGIKGSGAIEKGSFRSPSTKVANFTLLIYREIVDWKKSEQM